jgi:D-mannonate dehydratase
MGKIDSDFPIKRSEMSELANHIETYLEVLEDVFIIPDHIKSSKKKMDQSIEITKKLIRKLRKGDISVFKDPDDWYEVT